ncbi:hypothetical protein NUW54_g11652 [Trametes sanguinea]|uniref:Uncharacterized protein n=1 Tax=Trametes sanguinea TaxID=158606 RepID=A0ACC1NA86_9APHY|nr:hypothetical protein NUW54_g11652 [Trametes sanguinea]
MELQEIQKPDLGRKFARKDKRPLDPPPVVLCRFYETLNGPDGRRIEVEMDPATPSLGAVCHLDLFPVPHQYYEAESRRPPLSQATTQLQHHAPELSSRTTHVLASTSTLRTYYDGLRVGNTMAQSTPISLHGATTPNHYTSQAVTSSTSGTLSSGRPALLPCAGDPSTLHDGSHVTPDPAAAAEWQEGAPPAGLAFERDIIATCGDFQICESSKYSDALSGTMSTHAEVIDYKGKISAVFVFSVSCRSRARALSQRVWSSGLELTISSSTSDRTSPSSRRHVCPAIPTVQHPVQGCGWISGACVG